MPLSFASGSLHRRLGVALLCVACLVGLLGAAGTFLVVQSLATEFDTSLRQAVAHVRSIDDPTHKTMATPMPSDLVIQIWDDDDVSPSKSSNPYVMLPKAPLGFSSLKALGRHWDVFALGAGNNQIQVAELHSVRTSNAIRVAFWSLLPVLALLPVLGATIATMVRISLRPLDQIGNRVAAIDLNHLQVLDTSNAPRELWPFLDSINLMIERLSERIGAERQFIANAAHELRSPISAIQLHVDNLRNAPPEQFAERLDALQRGVGRTASLVSQLLGLARAETGASGQKKTELALPRLVADVVADLLPLALNRGVDIGAERLDDVTIRASEADLRVLVKNLVDNAIRYGGAGAHVDVSVYRERGHARIQVLDDGPGIAADDLERVFDRFYRGGASDEEGSGLGLSIARTLATNYGGRVTIANRTDGVMGVVASIDLPLS